MWIKTTGLLFCILIIQTSSVPLPQEDSDEADSNEEPETTTVKIQQYQASTSRYTTQQELKNGATSFLSKYFYSPDANNQERIPPKTNHTIIITIVPSNAQEGFEIAAINTEFQNAFKEDAAILSLGQNLEPMHFQSKLPTQGQAIMLTPVENLVGFVPAKKRPAVVPAAVVSRGEPEATVEAEITSILPTSPSTSEIPAIKKLTLETEETTTAAVKENSTEKAEELALESISIIDVSGEKIQEPSRTPPVISTQPPLTKLANKNSPNTNSVYENLANANLATLNLANPNLAHSQANVQSESTSNSENIFNENSGPITIPSSFGPVFIQPEEDQPNSLPITAPIFANKLTPAPEVKDSQGVAVTVPSPPLVQQAPLVPQPNIIYLQPYYQPQTNPNPSNIPTALQQIEQLQSFQRPNSTMAFQAASGILGSIAQANLTGAVQNGFKLVGTPIVQDVAKAATFTILHSLFAGINACNLLGQCPQNQQQQLQQQKNGK